MVIVGKLQECCRRSPSRGWQRALASALTRGGLFGAIQGCCACRALERALKLGRAALACETSFLAERACRFDSGSALCAGHSTLSAMGCKGVPPSQHRGWYMGSGRVCMYHLISQTGWNGVIFFFFFMYG